MEREDITIHVDNIRGNDAHDGVHQSVKTADRAFSLLPPSWYGRAEIIFEVTNREYPITTSAVYFGTPVGSEASSLVIRGGYASDEDFPEVIASSGSRVDEINTNLDIPPDRLIGAVLTRLSGTGSPVGTATMIRGNSAGPDSTIFLQRAIDRIEAGDTFAVQRPAVTLKPDPSPHYPSPAAAGQALNLTSHDARSPNLKLVGIKFAPFEGRSLNFLNVRAQCDTCEFLLQASSVRSTTFSLHTNSRIQAGIETDPLRSQAGVYIHSNGPSNLVWAVRDSVLGGHLTFDQISVRASQGGVFVPKSLEARESPIQILAGGSALAEIEGWGTATNKARIRNVATRSRTGQPDGDGLRVFNGGVLNSPLAPINLDISGCNRDAIRLDMGSLASFGPPNGLTGLVTTGANNGVFGMNVRNASRALVGLDTDLHGAHHSATVVTNDVALDDVAQPRGWGAVTDVSPPVGNRLSSVRRNT